MSIFRQLLTGADNQTHDVGRYIAVGCVLTALALEIFVVVHKDQPFDIQNFGTGIGILVAGLGAMLKFKESTEPATIAVTVEK